MTSRRMLAGIALGILLLTINASTAFVRMRDLDENNRRVAQTHRVLSKLQETHSLLQAAEAGKHRFLLVADPEHFAPLRVAVTTVGDRLSELRVMTSGNPRHQARLDRLQALASDRVREFKAATEFRETNHLAIREYLRAQPGRLALDQIRILVEEMRAEEEALLERHDARSQASLTETRSTVILSSLADFVLVALACWLIRRDARMRRNSERNLRNYAETMELTNRELSRLCEEAEAATRAKSEFLANMSHEIRTPMTAILGHAELLRVERPSADQISNSAMAIQRNGEHLLQLINDILDLSKIEAGKLSIEQTRCSPFELLSEVRSMMAVRAAARGLSFDLAFEGSVPEFLDSDPTRLRQILLNLVGNAIKFTERGSVRLVCRMEAASPEAPPRLCVDVIDTGIGIRPDLLKHLFRPFVQADSSTTRRFGGTGLGLFISRHLAEALGGTLDAVSQPGAGSRFTLALPVGALDTTRMVDSSSAENDSRQPLSGIDVSPPDTTRLAHRRVLLAEDGVDNQYLISLHLQAAGMEVDVVDNGMLAVECALAADRNNRRYAVILMDMQMPEMDGYSAVAQLRHEHYSGRIVALTAHAMDGDREKCLAAGCDDYLSKPATRDQLLRAVAANLVTETSESPADSAAPVSLESATEFDSGLAPIVSTLAGDRRMIDAIDRFVDRLPRHVETLLHAADVGDRATLSREAHRLKGSAGGYGFQPLTEAAAALEISLTRASDHQEIDLASLHELVDLCRRATSPHEGPRTEREDAPHSSGN